MISNSISRPILYASGIVMLISLLFILYYQSFSVWIVAKTLYGVGVLFFVFNK